MDDSCGTMAHMSTADVARPAASRILGLLAGSLVNVAGTAAFVAGWGLSVYWVLMTVAVMVGVAAWRSARSRWFGVGLTVGCVAVFVALIVVVRISVR